MARVNEIAFTEIKGTATIKATCRKESDDIRDDEMPTGVVDDNMTLLPEGAWRFGNKVAKTDENMLWLRNISLIDEESLEYEMFTITIEDGSIGSTTGGGNYSYGDEAYLNAIPAEGEHFLGWITPNGTYIKDSETSVIVEKNMIYKAYFTSDNRTNEYSNAVIADSKYNIRFNPSTWYMSSGYLSAQSRGHLSNVPLSAVITVPDGEEDMLSFDYYTMFNNYYEENKVEGYFSVHVNGKEELRIPYNQREEGNVYNVPLVAGTNTVEWNFIETENPNSDEWNLGICNIDIFL